MVPDHDDGWALTFYTEGGLVVLGIPLCGGIDVLTGLGVCVDTEEVRPPSPKTSQYGRHVPGSPRRQGPTGVLPRTRSSPGCPTEGWDPTR